MEPARARAKSKRRYSDRASVRIGGKPAAPCNARRNSARFRIRGRRVHRRERWRPGTAATKAAPKEELGGRRRASDSSTRTATQRGGEVVLLAAWAGALLYFPRFLQPAHGVIYLGRKSET